MKIKTIIYLLGFSLFISSVSYAEDSQWLETVLDNSAKPSEVVNSSIESGLYSQSSDSEILVTLENNEDYSSSSNSTQLSTILDAFNHSEEDEARGEYQHNYLNQTKVIELAVNGSEFINNVVQVNDVNGLAYFEGDIILGSINNQKSAVSMGERHRRWPKGIVPYQFDASLSDVKIQDIKAAIQHWHLYTPIRLVERTDQRNYVLFRKSPTGGCSSYVGMRGGEQQINVADWCKKGSLIHEIGHTLGLWHEQSREDRDQYIQIDYMNIKRDHRHNFARHIRDGEDVGEYDYDSIMHYSSGAFSINGQPTIIPKKQGVQLGQRKKLSAGDVAGINKMYPLAIHQPNCTSNRQYRAPECVAAMQQACSSPLRGGAGISQEVGDTYLSVACLKPLWQGDIAISRLRTYNRECSSVNQSQKTACYHAAQQYCNNEQQLKGGMVQGGQGQTVNIACFTPKWQGIVSFTTLKSHFHRCTALNNIEQSGCVAAVHRYCRSEHKANAGVIQKIHNRQQVSVACFSPTIYSNMPLTSAVASSTPSKSPSNGVDIDQIIRLFE